MGRDLFGNNLTVNFSASGLDANAPYTNAEGPNPQSATLTLVTGGAGVVVTEQANAIEQTADAIGLVLAGPGEFVFQGANAYSGGTTLEGGALSIGSASAIGSGELTFAGSATLEATVTATLSNALVVKGFDVGGGTNDALDVISGWSFTGATEGATSTTLAFVDGAAHANIVLQGAYSGTFSQTAITGGTKITYVA